MIQRLIRFAEYMDVYVLIFFLCFFFQFQWLWIRSKCLFLNFMLIVVFLYILIRRMYIQISWREYVTVNAVLMNNEYVTVNVSPQSKWFHVCAFAYVLSWSWIYGGNQCNY